MSDNIEHRAFWDMDHDGDIALPYTGWYPLEKIVEAQTGGEERRRKKMNEMQSVFNDVPEDAYFKLSHRTAEFIKKLNLPEQ